MEEVVFGGLCQGQALPEQAAGYERLIYTPASEKRKSPQPERGQVLGTSVS